MKTKEKHILKRVKLKKLFGTFNHNIEVNHDKGITLILGENGLGKTVVLKLLKLVFEGDFINLLNYEFERFDLYFDDFTYSFFGTIDDSNKRLVAKLYKKNFIVEEFDLLENSNHIDLHFLSELRSRGHGLDFENDFLYDYDNINEIEAVLQKYIPSWFKRIRRNRWINRKNGRLYTTSELIQRFEKHLPNDFNRFSSIPEWLEELSKRITIYIIETQRLRTRKGGENFKEAIINISDELSKTIKGLLARANEVGIQLDRTYPTRLLNRINKLETITKQELLLKLDNLDSRRKRLKEVGLVEPFEEELQRTDIVDNVNDKADKSAKLINNVLLVYVEDSNDKLNIYEEIADKLEVFVKILNERLNVKKIFIDKEKGFEIRSTKTEIKSSILTVEQGVVVENTVIKKKEIPLTGLSSGEQHMIVLLYNLLFNCKQDSLVLIDEPEISLHIGWQNEFINDLNRIKEINPFDVIIATHSPDVINKNWDLTVQLLDE